MIILGTVSTITSPIMPPAIFLTVSTPSVPIATSTPVSTDTTVPAVQINTPAVNSIVPRNSIVTVTASATVNVQVAKIQVLVNNIVICQRDGGSMDCSWGVGGKEKQDIH